MVVMPSANPMPAAPGAKPAGKPRIALAHDWLVAERGGEHVLSRIAKLCDERHAPGNVYTLFQKKKFVLPAIAGRSVRVSPLNGWPMSGALRRWLLPMYPWAIDKLAGRLAQDHAAEPVNLLISTSSGLIKGMDAPIGVRHLCYCHSPPRYLWHAEAEYTRGSALRSAGLGRFGERLRAWDRKSVANVDAFVANSRHTAQQIQSAYGRDARVIHPPVRTERFTLDPTVKREEFWLVVSALEPYKRVDIAIEAAMAAGRRLIIAGTGSQAKELKKHVKATARHFAKVGLGAGRDALVEFLGRVPDEQLVGLYRRARCLLFPQVEDFGIVAAEAQACGCPVIARRAGGALDIVLEGRTGMFFDDPTAEGLRKAAEKAPTGVEDQCRVSAERFAEARFDQQFGRIIEEVMRA